jgi:UDP-glucose:(heptosyl)LPS alpha-1,3-glucosyltransferase
VTEPNSVTIVAHDIGPNGGMERVLLELIKGLVAAGDRVTVIARTCDAPGLGIVFHRVPGPSRPFVIAYPWFFIAAGLILRRHRDGLVQTTGAIVANRVDITSVHFCHRGFESKVGIPRASRSGLLFHFHARLAAAMARIGERLCYRPSRVSHVVAVSRGVAEELRDHYPAIADAIVVIPNGVDVDRFAPSPVRRALTRSKLGLPNDALVALFVGGDWERKGLALAIDALAESPRWTLLIAGSGDQKHYLARAKRSDVADRTTFLGAVADIAPIFQAADVFVLPTAYEADPLVALEAAATGLAVLATPVNGIVDLIRDTVSGYRIQRDAASIADRLMQLAALPDVLARMGAEARLAAAGRSWHSVVRLHRELYATLHSA